MKTYGFEIEDIEDDIVIRQGPEYDNNAIILSKKEAVLMAEFLLEKFGK